MTIQTFVSGIGLQYSRLPALTLLFAAVEWAFFLAFADCTFLGSDSFDSAFHRPVLPHPAGEIKTVAVRLSFFLLYTGLGFLHHPIALNCVLEIVVWSLYLSLFIHIPWHTAAFASSIFCLFLEIGKSIPRGGTVAWLLSSRFPQLSGASVYGILCALFLLYLCVCTILFRRTRYPLSTLSITSAQTASLLLPLVLYLAVRQYQSSNIDALPLAVSLHMDILQIAIALCNLIIFYVTTRLLDTEREKNELLQQTLLAGKQHAQYLIQKESLDAVNRKYHDLKHYLSILESGPNSEEVTAFIRRFRQEISPYETIQETGNRTMNILLAERIRECQEKQIAFIPYIEGEGLSVFSTADLCTLFGNAMDNAIEASLAVEDPALREISVKIGRSDAILLLRFQNYFSGTLQQKDGKVYTTKADASSHGYGLESIRSVAEKYGGAATWQADGTLFVLTVMVPLSPP